MAVEVSSILVSLVSPIISGSLILIGWKVLYGNAKRISSRGETQALYQQACKLLYDIEELSESFWLEEKHNASPSTFEMLILNKIKRLNKVITRIKERDVNVIFSQFLLRKSCTLHSFSIGSQGFPEKRLHMDNTHFQINKIEQDLSDALLVKYPHS